MNELVFFALSIFLLIFVFGMLLIDDDIEYQNYSKEDIEREIRLWRLADRIANPEKYRKCECKKEIKDLIKELKEIEK